MLHYDPKQRAKLRDIFSNKFLSPEVANNYSLTKN
jgi:hypothetical protein